MPQTATQTTTRSLRDIAKEIQKDWQRPYFGARPYLEAMHELDSLNDRYGADSGRSIVLYFLTNAASWRGEVAKRVKQELRDMLGETRRR